MSVSLCILQEGVCCFCCKDISQHHTHRCHSNTYDVSSYFLALAGSNRVNYSLLDVSTADDGDMCVNCGGQGQSVHVQHFVSGSNTLKVRTLVLLALASFPAHQYRQSTNVWASAKAVRT